jgi:hypothetical protein
MEAIILLILASRCEEITQYPKTLYNLIDPLKSGRNKPLPAANCAKFKL